MLRNGEFGGTQKLVLGLASGARDAGHETTIATAAGQPTRAVQGQTMFELPVVDSRLSPRIMRTCATYDGLFVSGAPMSSTHTPAVWRR